MMSPCLDVNIRSYGAKHPTHSHAFDQLVLPLDGDLLIEVGGREDRLMPGRIAVVARGERHTQTARKSNRSLIVDLAPQALAGEAEELLRAPFLTIDRASARLVDFMEATLTHEAPSAAMLAHWTSLLIASLTKQHGSVPRLTSLFAAIERAPGEVWTLPRMAALAALSTSRLHTIFREALQCTPTEWLTRHRMKLACDLLQHSLLPIGEIGWRCGYSNQSAFTRAFQRAYGVSPATLRKTTQPQ